VADTTQHTYIIPFRFTVVGSRWLNSAGFSRVSGLSGEVEIMEWRELTDPATPRKLPKELVFGDITFERGMTTEKGLRDWWSETQGIIVNGARTLERETVTVTAYDRNKSVEATWEIYEAWPRVLKWGDLDANTSGMLIETLVLANEGVRRL